MANIERISRVGISLRTSGITQQGYSRLALMGTIALADTSSRYMIITSPEQLLYSGSLVTTTSPLYYAALAAFSQTPRPTSVVILRRDAGQTAQTALTLAKAQFNDWYGMVETSHQESEALLVAAWAEANDKLNSTVLSSAAVATTATTDVGSALRAGTYFRTSWYYDPRPSNFPDVADLVRGFSKLPGGETYANQVLQGVQTVGITETQYEAIKAKNGNTYEPIRNLNVTQGGKQASGEWRDVVRFRDWLQEEASTEVFNGYVNNRIEFSDAGIQQIGQRLRSALDLGVRRRGIAQEEYLSDGKTLNPSFVIYLPRYADISFSDRTARILRDVSFKARLAGSIHMSEITGELTYENLA